MRVAQPLTTAEELQQFLLNDVRLRMHVSAHPVLTMQSRFVEGVFPPQEQMAPIWHWTAELFVVDEAEQSLERKRMLVHWYKDTKPEVSDLVDQFVEYASIINDIWDVRHSRCYGMRTWQWNYADHGYDPVSFDEAQAIYHEQKVLVQDLRALMGPGAFCRVRTMDVQ